MGIWGFSREFSGERRRRTNRPFGVRRSYWGFFLGVLVLDLISKWAVIQTMVLQQSLPLIGTFIRITYVRNAGAAFGWLTAQNSFWKTPFFIGIALAAVIVFTVLAYRDRRQSRLVSAALGMAAGGAMGNLVDRLFSGTVVGFIEIEFEKVHWPVFNLADAAVAAGMGLFLAVLLIRRAGK